MSNTLLSLKKFLRENNVKYFFLPSTDEFLNEFVSENKNRLKKITGFSGSNGFLVLDVADKKSAFFTDGRYVLQAKEELDEKLYKIFNISDKKPFEWILENANFENVVGFDSRLFSQKSLELYSKFLNKKNIKLVPINSNEFDLVLGIQNTCNMNLIEEHAIGFAGKDSMEKRKELTSIMRMHDINSVFLTNPEDVCWLFNIRGNEAENIPLVLAYAIVFEDQKAELFVDNVNRIQKQVDAWLWNVQIFDFNDLEKRLDKLEEKKVGLNLDKVNNFVCENLKKKTKKIKDIGESCSEIRSVKNSIEIQGSEKAHILDGLAVTKFLYWLDNSNQKELCELTCAEKLLEFRKQNKEFVCSSFSTISAFAENGAVIHYEVNQKTNKNFNKQSLYLVDSGGQYKFGTTDITRTISVCGKPSKKQKEIYTRVLQGHIDLASHIFSVNKTADKLDQIARKPLQEIGLDYDHGTGHGVGSFLSVHEGPCRISAKAKDVKLKPGQILSIEPGCYLENEFGVRIENLYVVERCDNFDDELFDEVVVEEKDKKLCFRPLTVVPIDLELVDFDTLDKKQVKWLKDYNEFVFEKTESGLGESEVKWFRIKFL